MYIITYINIKFLFIIYQFKPYNELLINSDTIHHKTYLKSSMSLKQVKFDISEHLLMQIKLIVLYTINNSNTISSNNTMSNAIKFFSY